jgi:hypothetical protein
VLSGLALFMMTGAASPSCSRPSSVMTTPSSLPPDPCNPTDPTVTPDGSVIASNKSCWPITYSPPSTNQAAIAHSERNRPGTVHVVIIAVDMANSDFRRINQPCFVVAIALAGQAPAINTETGLPYVDKQGITTPDVIKYELGLGVTQIGINVTSLAGEGVSMRVEATLDGRPYGVPDLAFNPLKMAGATRMLAAHVEVHILA